jgi:glycosyltransferase involved in cell wall biosynthesis
MGNFGDLMKVSVCMITYNHEQYIAQAIESALMQKTNFDFEIVIGEDCSTDRTRDIIIQYQKKYPERIKLLLNEKNVGGNQNFIRTLSACIGEYIAILEGDDFWTSPNKLQKQVNFLENHPECSICFHSVLGFYDDNLERKDFFIPSKKMKPISTIEDLLKENFIPTLSVMYRKKNIPRIPEDLTKSWMLDWPFHILIAKTGKIGYLDEVLGKYRRHENSLCSKKGVIQCYLGIVEMLNSINTYLDNKYDTIIKSTISKQYYGLSIIYLEKKDIPTAKKYFIKSLNTKLLNKQISKIGISLLFMKLFILSYFIREKNYLNK